MAKHVHTIFGIRCTRLFTSILLICLAFDTSATNHILRQDEAMAGLNGDPRVQFVQITVSGGDQKEWGPPGPGLPSRAMLVFFNGAGNEVGRFFFPANAPVGQNTVLIATTNFAALPGAPIPDFIMPALMSPGSGKVCFRGNPASPGAFDVNLCLSYGNFTGSTEGAGTPAPALPIIGDPLSLTRFQNFNFGQGTSRNADFTLASPSPENTRGQTMTFPVDGPEIQLIPSALEFGLRNIDQGPTGPQAVVITNRGVLNPLILTNVSLTGSNANQFAIVADTGQTTLLPGGTRTVTLNFDPTTPGRKTTSLRITCNDTNEIVTGLPLQGTGVDPNAPEIDVSPLTLSFADRDVALGASAALNVNIVNQGAIGALTIGNIVLTGTHASQFRMTTPTNGSTLTAGANRTASVIFDPDSAGPKTAVLRIVSGDTDEGIVDVTLQGRAFDLNPCTAPNPTNSVAQNSCVNAQLVCPGTVFTGTLLAATPDGSSSCGPGQAPDVWCRYVPAGDGTLTATATRISGGVQAFSAHSSCQGVTSNELACVNIPIQILTSSPIARITVPVTKGIPVLLRVAGVASANSVFQLDLEGPECFDFDQNQNGLTDNCEPDFGDAPAPYPTILAVNGARHRAFTGIFLGERIDPDDDGQPTAVATGDNLDGDINDDDGVVLTSPLIVGQSATLSVTASAIGFLNGWIDFNADGDWADAGEQVFANRALPAGLSALTLNVPDAAVITNLTFARYRFSSIMGLGFSGPANDGEVEDYGVEILSAFPTVGDLGVRINEVMAGLNGDSTIQFVELQVAGDADRAWGPQGSEMVGRAMLLFFDGAGVQSGRFVFPRNAPAGGDTVLVATRGFADRTGIQPDFIMPPEVVPIGGKVAFTSNPENRHFDLHIALSYGGSDYFGKTDGAGPANTNILPIMHAKSLVSVEEIPFGLNRNGGFQLAAAPSPRNTRGQTASLTPAPVAEQGRALFMQETFRGNGRACGTCHVPGRDQFGLTPITIDQLPHNDPLFVFEDNVNELKLTAPSRPSDLRGAILSATGSAKVLAGSGDTYLIVGGANLSGAIMDATGNSGTFQSFTEGDLDGPTPSNGSARGLEDHTLLTHGRGLILENIDGFKALEVFRASPHLLTLALTAPFGLSGEFDSLDDFSDGAVVQHFPKSLARISGVDFRHPTREELAAMSDFMFGISNPSTNVLNLDRLATTEAQRRGRALFFGDEGRCSKCHSGPVLALSDGSLSGSVSNVNENFNTGVANLLKNLPIGDNLPTEPAGLTPGRSTREFNTPGLFGIRLTAPFFHDGSARTLEDAVKFYDTEEFHNSPAGVEVGSLLAANKTEMIADVVAFLESLVELPVDFPREVAFGIRCPGEPLPGPQMAVITNLGSSTITISNVVLNGSHTNEFRILSDSGETTLGPGQTRRFEIAFAPASLGVKRTTLEITAVDTNLLGSFSLGIALTGADVDNFVTANPLAFDFGTRDIGAPPSPPDSIVITNDGSIALDVAIELGGANAPEFGMVTQTNAIPPHGTRVIEVFFAPETRGVKTAMIRVRMQSCSGTLIEIPLAGVATSTVQEFAWSSIAATQFVGMPFFVRITAKDANGDTVDNFRGVARLQALSADNPIPMSPTNSDPFVDGVWSGFVTIDQPASPGGLLARDSQGHTGSLAPFIVVLPNDLSLAVTDTPDPVLGGQPITYTLTVHNTGPADATGVLLSNQLPAGVTFLSGTTTRGSLLHSSGIVTASLGTLPRGATANLTILATPIPQTGTNQLTNVASVVRAGIEAVLANNRATNVTRVHPFGVLSVTPLVDFNSSGLSGGPFSPTNQIYTLSNSGTAALNWQARPSGCAAPPGLVGWWTLDGNTSDSAGTNPGSLVGNPVFTNGLVSQALAFDGTPDDLVRIPASPVLNVGAGAGLTAEAWINPGDAIQQRPVIEWGSEAAIGVHLWINVVGEAGSGPGSVFANIVDVNGPTSHQVVTAPGLVVSNVWQHVALTYSRNTGLATLYLNGVNVRQQNIGSFTPITSPDLLIGKRLFGGPSTFVGLIDEVGIYDRALTDAEIQSIFTAGAIGKCGAGGRANCLPGLVSWWPADGDTRGIQDSNNGVLVNGATFGTGLVGGSAFKFDGVNDKIELGDPDNLKFTNTFTIETWIFAVGLPRGPGPLGQIFFRGDTRGCLDPYSLAMQPNGAILLHVEDESGSPLCGVNLVTAPLPTNQWKHVAGVFDSGNMRIFIDGVLAAETTTSVRPFRDLAGGSVAIGNHSGGFSDQCFNGLIDDLAVYSRALSSSEIQSIFVAGATGKCRQRSWLSATPLTGTLSPGSRTNVTLTLNTNANQLPIGTHLQTVVFTNAANGRGTAERLARLAVVNRTPTLGALGLITIPEDSGPQVVNLTNISASGSEVQNLSIIAFSSNPALIANPIIVNYISPATSGTLIFTPLTNAHGTSIVSVVVMDDGSTENGGINARTNTLTVRITSVNDAPVFAFVADQAVNESVPLVINDIANDADLPNDQLTFTLNSAPEGLSINALSRTLAWTPQENQGPGVYPITITVNDAGVPVLTATNRFTLTVLEVNSPPVLLPLPSRIIHQGMPLSLNAGATDPDIPPNVRTYSLGPGAPNGAGITASGAFSWDGTGVIVPSTNAINVIVTDDGVPAQNDAKTFNVVVVSQPRIEITRSTNIVTLTWTAIPDVRYRVQARPDLGDPTIDWNDLPGDVIATGETASKTATLSPGGQRFYRVQVIP